MFRDLVGPASIMEACGAPPVTAADKLRHELFWAKNTITQLRDRVKILEREKARSRNSGKTESSTIRRRVGEHIIVDGMEQVLITVDGIEDGDDQAVRIKVTAPEECPIHTGENWAKHHAKDAV